MNKDTIFDVRKLSNANLAVVVAFGVVEDDDSDDFIQTCLTELKRRQGLIVADPLKAINPEM